jgi:NitT/TauT family transport system permease protein
VANLENAGRGSSERAKSRSGIDQLKRPKIRLNNPATIALVVIFIILWEILAQAGLISPIIFPAPSIIFRALWEGFASGEYIKPLFITTSRLLAGFLAGGGTGLILGLLMGWSVRLRKTLDPIIAALHPIPKFSLLPMVLIIFGIGETSRIVMISIGAFFPMLINTMGGVLEISPTYFEVVQNYGASKLDLFKKVVLPGSLPFVMTGARLALKSSLTISVGIEMVYGNSGLGSIAWLAWETMRMRHLYAIIIIISLIGVITNFTLERLKRVLVPWHQDMRSSE